MRNDGAPRIPWRRLLPCCLAAGTVVVGVLLLLGWLTSGLPLVLDIAVLGTAAATLIHLGAAAIAHRLRTGSSGLG